MSFVTPKEYQSHEVEQPDGFDATMTEILSNANDTLDEALHPAWSGIASPVVKHCKGVLIYTVVDRGLVITGHDGSGVVMAHNKDGSWSPPSAVVATGTGVGATVGYDKKNAIVFIMDPLTMKTFASETSGTAGIQLDLTAGPVGRAAELQADVGEQAVGVTYVYNFSKGLFVGAGFKATKFMVHSEQNKKFYNKVATSKEILDGGVTIPKGNSSVADLHDKMEMLANGKTKEQPDEKK